MKENCLMGKEYIELRSSLDALCRSFIENKETIRDTFPWDSVYLYPVCGAVFTDKRRRADGEQLKYCRDLLRDETGVFSSFRGLVRIAVISLLCAGGDSGLRCAQEAFFLFSVSARSGCDDRRSGPAGKI